MSGSLGKRKKLVIRVCSYQFIGRTDEVLFPSQFVPGKSFRWWEQPSSEDIQTASELLDLVVAVSSVREVSIISIVTDLEREEEGRPIVETEHEISLEEFAIL